MAATCTFCTASLVPSDALAEFGVCAPCRRTLDHAFIAGFGLVEGQHYEKNDAGDVTYWIGDATRAASSLWVAGLAHVRDWQHRPLADLVAATRDSLVGLHGLLPAPFAPLEATAGRCAACEQPGQLLLPRNEVCACRVCTRCAWEGLEHARCPACGAPLTA